MFNNLYKLFKNSSHKTPLEDFTTEGFANILKMFPEIRDAFCINFLQLPADNYSIETQYYQALNTEDPNCRVDLVIIGERHVCFIENKVESSEGFRQLLRYISALKKHHSDKKKYLRYCTKYADPKKIEADSICFDQFRWYQIAKFLKTYEENLLVKSYLEFLNVNKMSQDNTLKSENLITMENLRKTIEIAESHIDNSKDLFVEKFGHSPLNKNMNWDQIKSHNRVCYYVENVLKSETNKESEILYAVEFDNLKLISQIYLERNHEYFKAINKIQLPENFIKIQFDSGTAIQLNEDLGKFLNDVNADKLIQIWFTSSFEQLQNFIHRNSDLNWNILK